MKVRWNRNSLGGNLVQETEVLRKLELSQIKKQIEVLATFMPDLILNTPLDVVQKVQRFVGVLLFADVSGFTPLCEKYNKTGKGGIYRLTATLNAYIGAIVEVIYFYGGDVLKFSGDAFLALWKAEIDECLFKVIHKVIVCALFIQQTLGCFETEVNVLLKVKLAIACGNMTFSVIGDDDNRHYIIVGPAINDVKAAEHASVSGDVVIAPTAWGHVSEESYDVTFVEDGNVKVWRCLYKPNEKAKKNEYEQKHVVVQKLCDKHIKHQNAVHARKKFDDNLTDSKITEQFIRSLPQRIAVKNSTSKWVSSDLKPYIIKPVQEQVYEKQPLEYLTEMREVTIQFINIVPTSFHDEKLVTLIDNAYQIICSIVGKVLGIVNKVSLFDKDAMFLVLFGLRGIKHELESQNALKSAYRIRRAVSRLDGVKSISVGVTNGLVYCGVVGHPLRREYSVIGGAVNKAARIMCAYPYKVTCDYTTFKNSKLSSYYFELQLALALKGIEDAGHIFEYNEEFEDRSLYEKQPLPLIGRDAEIDLVHDVVCHSENMNNYHGICFHGKPKVGISKLVRASLSACEKEGHLVGSVELCGSSQRPYFCISSLYKQLYDAKAKIDSGDGDSIKSLPSDLWSLNDILQQKGVDAKGLLGIQRKDKITSLFREISTSSKTGVTVVFIDNVQYIDIQSLAVLDEVLDEQGVRLICGGRFEEYSWDIQWKLSLNDHVKMIELDPLKENEVPPLACQMLTVRGIPHILSKLLIRCCEGRPGWIQSCLLRLVNNGQIQLTFKLPKEIDASKYIFPDPELLNYKYTVDGKTKDRGKIVLSLAILSEKFNAHNDDLTLAAISLDLFDSFTPYQQLVVKTAAVLGTVFSRTLLYVMLNYPHELVFANAIKNLYEEEVLDCGARYVSSRGIPSKRLCCFCHFEDTRFFEVQGKYADMPKYAFCKMLHFKNRNLRCVAYELLPANQRKELHLRTTDVLENQNNLCPNCLRDNSAAIINLQSFKEIMTHCNENTFIYPYKKYTIVTESDSNKIKDIIRTSIRKNLEPNAPRTSTVPQSLQISPPKRKVWDPTTCFCLDILTRVYADLVYHSERAAHIGKRIFFLMQYGVIMVTLHEYQDAIPLLTEASELCMTDANEPNSIISDGFRRLHVGKIHMLLSEANYRLGKLEIAKAHVLISLRQYNVPMLSLKYTIPNKLLNREWLTKFRIQKEVRSDSKQTMLNTDLGMCMNLISTLFAAEGHWEMARLSAARSVSLLGGSVTNVTLICNAYCNAIDLYNYCGDTHTCERLERCISREILRDYGGNVTMELFALSKLIAVVFQARLMRGEITQAIRIGYRSIELNNTIQATMIQIEVIPVLTTSLLMMQRIGEAVEVARILQNSSKSGGNLALLAFYAFCLELILETSFVLETVETCDDFIESYMKNKRDETPMNADLETKAIICLYLYYLRSGSWANALKWKNLMPVDVINTLAVIPITNLFKYTEILLIKLVHSMEMKKLLIELEEKKVKTHLNQCKSAATKWKVFMPRYLHYAAYFKKVRNKKSSVKKYLRQALQSAQNQSNVLEHCWIMQSENSWNGGFSFGSEPKQIDWKLATTYSTTEWSMLLYALPHST